MNAINCMKHNVTTMESPPLAHQSPGLRSPSSTKILLMLFLANFLNVYDRVIPAVLVEPMRQAFNLGDFHIGMVGTAFTVVYALAGIPIGRWADKGSRSRVIGAGLIVWSGFTAISAAATGFTSFLLARIGVGIGEAACAPGANSLIGDLYPERLRSRAVGLFMLGLPLGTVAGFFTVSALATYFDSWRAPFLIASVPGILLGLFFLVTRDPPKTTSPASLLKKATSLGPVMSVLAIPTMRWIILTGIGYNFAAYAVGTFLVPLMQRYFQLGLAEAAMSVGVIFGVTGLLALTVGGVLADWVKQKASNGRLVLCSLSMALASVLTWWALAGASSAMAFCFLFGLGWLAGYLYIVCVYPTVQELVVPELRATAMAVFFAAFYLGGAAFGSVVVGAVSDHLATAAQLAAGAMQLTDRHRAIGLHDALMLVPVALLIGSFAAWRASQTFGSDIQRLKPR